MPRKNTGDFVPNAVSVVPAVRSMQASSMSNVISVAPRLSSHNVLLMEQERLKLQQEIVTLQQANKDLVKENAELKKKLSRLRPRPGDPRVVED